MLSSLPIQLWTGLLDSKNPNQPYANLYKICPLTIFFWYLLKLSQVLSGFRHYFTTTLVKHYKGDLLAVTHYTRHSNLQMLQVYNDEINAEADLPRYYQAFEGVTIWQYERPNYRTVIQVRL